MVRNSFNASINLRLVQSNFWFNKSILYKFAAGIQLAPSF